MFIIQKDKHLSVCVTADSRCAISCTKLMRRNLQILYCNPFTDRTALCGCNQLCPYTQSSLLFLIVSYFDYYEPILSYLFRKVNPACQFCNFYNHLYCFFHRRNRNIFIWSMEIMSSCE